METVNVTTIEDSETITISRAEYTAQNARIQKLTAELEKQEAYNSELERKLNWFIEQFYLNRNRRFGASSEASSNEVCEQMSFLFDEPEAIAAQQEEEKGTPVKSYTRKKRSGSLRDITPDNITVEEVRHELSEEERQCPKCGEVMTEIGTEAVDTLEFIPAKAIIHRDIYVHYACQNCKKNDVEVPIVEAPKEQYLLPGGFASSKAIAYIMVQKFVMYIPLYRQEQEWNRRGVMLSRQTLSDWFLLGAELLTVVYTELHRVLLTMEILHADETTLQVLHEPGRSAQTKSYMWLYMTGAAEERQIILYEYQAGRSASFPRAFLSGFSGYLQTDGYSGYNDVEDVIHVGCWSHLRRKFDEAAKALPKDTKSGAAITGQAYCTKLFMKEREFQQLSPEERYQKRLEQEKPLLDDLEAWAKTRAVGAKSKLGQAFSYLQNQWVQLTNYLLDGRLEISNNRAERSIKPFVMGRKNFLFANTPRGAKASAVVYSLIETAKVNELDPYQYLVYLLDQIPKADQSCEGWIEPLLPWNAPADIHLTKQTAVQ